MPEELGISISRREDADVEITVPTEQAESLYKAIRKANLSAAFPKPYIFRRSLKRTKDGKVVPLDEPAESYIDVADPEKKIDAIVGEWLGSQS